MMSQQRKEEEVENGKGMRWERALRSCSIAGRCLAFSSLNFCTMWNPFLPPLLHHTPIIFCSTIGPSPSVCTHHVEAFSAATTRSNIISLSKAMLTHQ